MTTTDRELLERAAKAAGIDGQYECWAGQGFMEGIRRTGNPKEFKIWNPLMYDDQALRLASDCFIDVAYGMGYVTAIGAGAQTAEEFERDDIEQRRAATRRAIVRAAAAMAGEGE